MSTLNGRTSLCSGSIFPCWKNASPRRPARRQRSRLFSQLIPWCSQYTQRSYLEMESQLPTICLSFQQRWLNSMSLSEKSRKPMSSQIDFILRSTNFPRWLRQQLMASVTWFFSANCKNYVAGDKYLSFSEFEFNLIAERLIKPFSLGPLDSRLEHTPSHLPMHHNTPLKQLPPLKLCIEDRSGIQAVLLEEVLNDGEFQQLGIELREAVVLGTASFAGVLKDPLHLLPQLRDAGVHFLVDARQVGDWFELSDTTVQFKQSGFDVEG